MPLLPVVTDSMIRSRNARSASVLCVKVLAWKCTSTSRPRDLDASVAFYRTLLLAEPAKHFTDYALFLTDEPGLELALDHNSATDVREGAHYGVVVEKPEEVNAVIARLQAAGYPVDVETNETCCYAVQNKV
jgi:hypothetical protein